MPLRRRTVNINPAVLKIKKIVNVRLQRKKHIKQNKFQVIDSQTKQSEYQQETNFLRRIGYRDKASR